MLEIETEQDIRAIGDYITENEYKDYYTLNNDSLRLVSEFRNPALIFFTKGEENAFLDKLKTMAKVYKDDLITIIVDIYQDDKLTNFIVNFMGITRLPSLRILDLSHGVERFAYKGKLNQEDVYTFIGDYVDNMVNAYKISETIPKTHREVNGIRKINSKGLEKIFHNINNNYLIYVHAENLTGKAPDYVLLNKLKKSLDINTHFNLVSIDFEKNDVGANYIEELPLFMLATKNNKLIDHTGDLSFEAVKTFLTEELPYLQFSESEPEITNV